MSRYEYKDNKTTKRGRPRKNMEYYENIIITLYKTGMSITDIADMYNVNFGTIKNYLLKWGVYEPNRQLKGLGRKRGPKIKNVATNREKCV